jgi:hypothetical protein
MPGTIEDYKAQQATIKVMISSPLFIHDLMHERPEDFLVLFKSLSEMQEEMSDPKIAQQLQENHLKTLNQTVDAIRRRVFIAKALFHNRIFSLNDAFSDNYNKVFDLANLEKLSLQQFPMLYEDMSKFVIFLDKITLFTKKKKFDSSKITYEPYERLNEKLVLAYAKIMIHASLKSYNLEPVYKSFQDYLTRIVLIAKQTHHDIIGNSLTLFEQEILKRLIPMYDDAIKKYHATLRLHHLASSLKKDKENILFLYTIIQNHCRRCLFLRKIIEHKTKDRPVELLAQIVPYPIFDFQTECFVKLNDMMLQIEDPAHFSTALLGEIKKVIGLESKEEEKHAKIEVIMAIANKVLSTPNSIEITGLLEQLKHDNLQDKKKALYSTKLEKLLQELLERVASCGSENHLLLE